MSSLPPKNSRNESSAATPYDGRNDADEAGHRALMVEAMFGERVPQCRKCGAVDEMFNDYTRAAMRCKCGWLEANERVLMVPKDERLRREPT